MHLETYATFAADDLLTQVVLERMLAGVATRRHRAVAEPMGTAVEAEAASTSRSSVSRRFKAATASALEELMSRDLSGLAVAAMMIDGVVFAEHCCVVALVICTDGRKVPVGLWLGDTENKTVVTTPSWPRRSPTGTPPPACGRPRSWAKLLDDRHPDAAASLREGLEDMFTVRRLGLSDHLARTLSNTNAIESISIARSTASNVKRWRDGKMIKRWVAAGMLNAERSFRRVKALQGHAHPRRRSRPSRQWRCHTLMPQ